MKKNLFSVGAASLAIAMFATGCASTAKQASLLEEVKKAEAVVAKSHGLEKHEKQPDKYLLPNVLLEQTKVLYINWAAVATDSILLRFGDADVISVARDTMDTSNLKLWDAIRNADADKTKADDAEKQMKKFVAESYAKNKTTSKMSADQMFNTVVGKVAQEDYVEYKKAVKAGAATEADYKDQKTWLGKGKANIIKVAAEQKKRLAEIEKRLAKAEKDAEAAKRKVELTVQYYGSKAAYAVFDAQAKSAANPLAKKGFEASAKKAKDEMDAAEKGFPQVSTVLKLTPIKIASVQDAKAFQEAIQKELAPWKYAKDIGSKRWDSFWEVKKWANEAQKTLDEVSGN